MARKTERLLSLTLLVALFPGSAGQVAAQSANRMETQLYPNVTLPQTAWMRGEVLGSAPPEARLKETVDLLLHQRGFQPQPYSPYVVRIELRSGATPPGAPAIPQYSKPAPRLSLWNDIAPPDSVTLSLTLYHQSTGRIYWQAEGRCTGLTPDALAASMVAPLMNEFGRTTSGELACTSSS